MPTRRRTSISDDGDDGTSRSGRQVKHILKACNECRKRKMRCDGAQPVCAACDERGISCVYSDEDKRRTNSVQMEELKSRLERMEQLLTSLLPGGMPNPIVHTLPVVATIAPSRPSISSQSPLGQSRPIRPLPNRIDTTPLLDDQFHPNAQTYGNAGSSSSLSPEAVMTRRMELGGGGDQDEGRFQRIDHSVGSLAYSGATSLWTYSAGRDDHEDRNASLEESRTLLPGDMVHWSQNLPPAVSMSRDVHDLALDYFRAYYAPWCLVIDMREFQLDLDWCNTIRKAGSHRPPPPRRTAHYSPLLHCCVLYLGLYLIKDRHSALMQVYDSVFISHCSTLLYTEADSGSIGSLRGYNLFAICAHCVRSAAPDYQASAIPKPTMTGFLYAGMGMAGVHALSLNVDCSNYVAKGQITAHEKNIRDYAFWSLHIVDALRAIPHGRQPVMTDPDSMPLPLIDSNMDDAPWVSPPDGFQTGHLVSPSFSSGSRSMQSTTLHHLASLSCIIRRMMRILYIPQPNRHHNDAAAHDLSQRLDQWYSDLPLKPAHALPVPHVLTLHLIYHLVVILVHRLFYRSNLMGSKQKCEDAANAIMPLLRLFGNNHDLRYGHHNLTNVIFAAATIFLLSYAGAPGSHPRQAQSRDQFDHCIAHMKRLGQTWPEATKASNVLESLKSEFMVSPPDGDLSHGSGGDPVPTADVDLDGLHQWLSGQDFWGTFFPDQTQWPQTGWDGTQGIDTGLLP